MSTNRTISDPKWVKIYQFLSITPGIYTNNEARCRLFIEAVFWIMRTGAQWRDLPGQYGKWNSVYQQFSRWDKKGIWSAMHEYFIDDPDMEWLLLDSTVVRAHPCAAGALKKTAGKTSKR